MDDEPSPPVTRAVKDAVPVAVGVPVMTPDPESPRPVGSAPDATDHAYGVVPPAAARLVEGYATPVVPSGSVAAVMVGGVPDVAVQRYALGATSVAAL